MSDLQTVVWEISWPEINAPLGRTVVYSGHNSAADYRAAVHADAKSRELVYRDEAEVAIRGGERERNYLAGLVENFEARETALIAERDELARRVRAGVRD